MTEGYTPSDISALCGAAINSLLTERKNAQRKENKKEKDNSLKSDNNNSKNSPKMIKSSRKLGIEVSFFFFLLLF